MTHEMTHEELSERLYQRMNDEQEKFRAWIRTLPKERMLENAYELFIREDILFSFEENDYSDKRLSALLSSESPLADLYNSWENFENRHMDDIRNTVEVHADELILNAKAKEVRDSR